MQASKNAASQFTIICERTRTHTCTAYDAIIIVIKQLCVSCGKNMASYQWMNCVYGVFCRENLASDCFHGCFVVTCTLCAFISLVWLREQILHGGGPDWLEQDNQRRNNNRVGNPTETENNIHNYYCSCILYFIRI